MRIIKHILYMLLFILFRNSNIMVIRDICSIKLDNMYGNIFCLPQKYPFIIEDIVINGMVSDIHIIGKYSLDSLNRISDINFEFIVINKIIIKFIISDIGIIDINSSIVL